MRSGAYDARKVDVWSTGATAWEMAEAEPPFMDLDVKDPQQLPTRWPALSQSDIYSPSFHDFLSLCSNPPLSRPSPNDLLMVSPCQTARWLHSLDSDFICYSDTFHSFSKRKIPHCGTFGPMQEHRGARSSPT